MFIILGLGNPGNKYEKTRHNVAWIVFDFLNKNLDWQKNKYAGAFVAPTSIGDADILFVKPETFMNESGKVLPYFAKEYGITEENIVVVHDDIDLPFGEIKISYDRGDGGHNGVKSIMESLGSKAFTRIRIGVSITDENGVLHKPDVLGNFSKDEISKIKTDLAPTIAGILQTIVEKGREKAMSAYN